MKYKVTKWGNFEDEDYIDVFLEGLRKRNKYFENVDKVTRRMVMELPKEEINKRTAKWEKDIEETNQKYVAKNQDQIELENSCIEAVINELRETGYHFSGEFHQGGTWGCPIVNDKYKCCFSFTEWGNIMAKAFPDDDYSMIDKEENRYCKWAWHNPDLYEEFKYPNGGVK